MSDLSYGLVQLQRNTAIPEVRLLSHPIITEAVMKAIKQGRRPVIEDVETHLADSTFLNNLQKQVATWVTEIHKVSI